MSYNPYLLSYGTKLRNFALDSNSLGFGILSKIIGFRFYSMFIFKPLVFLMRFNNLPDFILNVRNNLADKLFNLYRSFDVENLIRVFAMRGTFFGSVLSWDIEPRLRKYVVMRAKYNTNLERIFVGLPFIIIIFLVVPSFSLLYVLSELHEPIMVVKVIGHQWYWSYEVTGYPYYF